MYNETLENMRESLDSHGKKIERAIALTPSGAIRNALTEANIHRMAYDKALIALGVALETSKDSAHVR